MDSMWAQYQKELYGRESIINENGLITYQINGDECYIVDIYVRPEARRSTVGTTLANMVTAEAKTKGCKYLSGTVSLAQKKPTESLKALLSYGFQVVASNETYLTLIKKLED